jgi:hypothetical protein
MRLKKARHVNASEPQKKAGDPGYSYITIHLLTYYIQHMLLTYISKFSTVAFNRQVYNDHKSFFSAFNCTMLVT